MLKAAPPSSPLTEHAKHPDQGTKLGTKLGTNPAPEQTKRCWIGLMSGTSLDGVDAVALDMSQPTIQVLGHHFMPFPSDFKDELLQLNAGCDDELHRAALAANRVSELYAQCTQALLTHLKLQPQAVHALGAHGQTVRHQPQAHDAWGYTLQLLNPALLAELTQIDVVSDFRSRDLAAQGQGAPLVPAFHQAIFGHPHEAVAVFNLGGMSNLSWLPAHPAGALSGFDCGPGNVLMDHWCQRHTQGAFDENGRWAKQGQVLNSLLDLFLEEPFFLRPPPKSTGRDLFDPPWLQACLQRHQALHAKALRPEDVQATLCDLTAHCCVEALSWVATPPENPRALEALTTVVLCGGGALNEALFLAFEKKLQQRFKAQSVKLLRSEALGWRAQEIEASAFAWLAHQHFHRLAGNVPKVTGALGPRVLGSHTPA